MITLPQWAAFFLILNVLPALSFVFYFTRNRESVGVIDRVVLAIILSPLALVMVSMVEEAAGLPQNKIMLAINALVLGLLNVCVLAVWFRDRRHYHFGLTWPKAVAYGLFVALVLFRVLPTLDLLVPIMHDPVVHTEWLKHLHTAHFSPPDEWYPQGLEYYLNYYVTFVDVSYQRAIIISNNFLLALFPISLFYLGLLAIPPRDRRLIFPLIMLVVAASLPTPTSLYFTAGKNAMIFAYSVIPPLLYLIMAARERRQNMLTAMFLFGTVVIHYPTGFFMIFIFFFLKLREVVGFEERRISIDRYQLYGYLQVLGVVLLLAAVLAWKILPTYLVQPISDERSFDYLAELIDDRGILAYAYLNFMDDMVGSFSWTPVILLAGALSAFLLVRDKNRILPSRILAAYGALYLLGIVVLLAADVTTGIFYNIELRFFLVFVMVIMVSWFLFYLIDIAALRRSQSRIISAAIVAALAAFFLLSGFSQYRDYLSRQDDVIAVYDADLRGFDFIRENIPGDRKILIQLVSIRDDAIIAGADSGMWIPFFTDKEIKVPFQEFSNPESVKIFYAYQKLAEDSRDVAAARELYCEHDIGYIFFGSRPVYADLMQEADLEKSPLFEKIYGADTAIFRIKDVGCTATRIESRDIITS